MALATAYGRQRARKQAAHTDIALPPVQLLHGAVIPEYVGKILMTVIGIPVPQGVLAASVSEAEKNAAHLGYPVVLKAQSGELPHKSDAGGVIVNIRDDAALAEAWERLHRNVATAKPGLELVGVLVEAMAKPGLEMVVGGRRDPDWGPVVMVGLGGVWIEVLEDVRLMPADIGPETIADEIMQLKAARLLQGLRGQPPADVEALCDVLARIGALMRAHPHISEIDLNPLIVYPQGEGVMALDVLIVTRE
jgi:acyl-CoA synthetase (NDP forming)